MDKRTKQVTFGILFLLGLTALGLSARSASSSSDAEIRVVAAEVDGQLDVVAERARGRVDGLVNLPRMAWAVSTNVATVRDLTAEELTLTPRPGETIEIAQWNIAESRSTRLLRQPAEGAVPEIPIERAGEHFIASSDGVFVAVVRMLAARQRADAVQGLVAVAERWDPTVIEQRLSAMGARLRIESPGGQWGPGPAPGPGETSVIVPLRTAVAPGGRLVFTLRAAGSSRRGLFLVAGLVLVLGPVLGLWLDRRRTEGATRGGQPEPAPSVAEQPAVLAAAASAPAEASEITRQAEGAPVETEFDDSPITATVVNTLSAVAGGAGLGEAKVEAAPLAARNGRAASSPLPVLSARRASGSRPSLAVLRPLALDSSHPEVPIEHLGSGSVPSLSPGEDLGDPPITAEDWRSLSPQVVATLRRLFEEYLALRRTCGESTDDIDYDKFATTLRRRRQELIDRHLFKEVRFSIAFNDGRAIVRSTGVR